MAWRRVSDKSGRILVIDDLLKRCNKWVDRNFTSIGKPGTFPPKFFPLPLRALSEPRTSATAVCDRFGKHSYGELLLKAVSLSKRLSSLGDYSLAPAREGLSEQVAILVPNDHRYVVCQWAAWLSGLCAVPLHHSLPESLLSYHITDSQSRLVMVTEDFNGKLDWDRLEGTMNVLVIPESLDQENLETARTLFSNEAQVLRFWRNRDAQIVYTSGTTGPPKGVVATHPQLLSQAAAVASEWFLNPGDTVLHHLPLHHTHGIVNALLAPLFAGAKIHMLPKFSPQDVWQHLLQEDNTINVLMGVPTMYAKLIHFAKERFSGKIPLIRDFLQMKLRLCTCGSASLPDTILQDWRDLSGHMLLERYGMSEFGMGLGNPLPESERKIGYVGRPFPGIRVRISERDAYSKSGFRTAVEGDKYSMKKFTTDKEPTGDLLIKGPQVFTSYFNRPEETKKSFTEDGWFMTGDIASYDGEAFKILGRKSVDIIKCGGYKISALDVERVLLQHPKISEVAVVGTPDLLYGEKVVAIVVVSGELPLSEVQEFSAMHLPKNSIPSKLLCVESIPRNALGKVNKAELKEKLLPRAPRKSPDV